MDAERFDALSRTLAASSRRTILSAVGTTVAALLAGPLGPPETASGRSTRRQQQERTRHAHPRQDHRRPRHRQDEITSTAKNRRKLTAEGPCGDGGPRANDCEKDKDCCTRFCKQGRCRCKQLGEGCEEDRNCCGSGGLLMTCQNGSCQAVQTEPAPLSPPSPSEAAGAQSPPSEANASGPAPLRCPDVTYTLCTGGTHCCVFDQTCCGSSGCCDGDEECVGGQCLPRCPDETQQRCPGSTHCCAVDETCCGTGECCSAASDEVCVEGRCEPECPDETDERCPGGTHCCPLDQTCCGTSECCDAGEECTEGRCCDPAGAVCSPGTAFLCCSNVCDVPAGDLFGKCT